MNLSKSTFGGRRIWRKKIQIALEVRDLFIQVVPRSRPAGLLLFLGKVSLLRRVFFCLNARRSSGWSTDKPALTFEASRPPAGTGIDCRAGCPASTIDVQGYFRLSSSAWLFSKVTATGKARHWNRSGDSTPSTTACARFSSTPSRASRCKVRTQLLSLRALHGEFAYMHQRNFPNFDEETRPKRSGKVETDRVEASSEQRLAEAVNYFRESEPA